VLANGLQLLAECLERLEPGNRSNDEPVAHPPGRDTLMLPEMHPARRRI
jgi:hypothetical protein